MLKGIQEVDGPSRQVILNQLDFGAPKSTRAAQQRRLESSEKLSSRLTIN
jgi:hypothetical protein